MIEKIESYWKDWRRLPPEWYGISVNVADSYSPETKSLRQKLARMNRLRRWLSFRMRGELRRRKATEFMHAVMQRGEEAMAKHLPWVSVIDALPSDDGEVWVYEAGTGEAGIGYHSYGNWWCIYGDKDGLIGSGRLFDVIYWQPIIHPSLPVKEVREQ